MLSINEIYKGDCLELMKDIDDKSVDLIVTDHPYLMKYKTSYRKDKNHPFCSEIIGDDDPLLISKYIKECHRILKNDSAMYLFCNSVKIDFIKTECEKYFKLKNIIVWIKNNHTVGDLYCSFGRKYEFIILLNKGKKKINGKRLTDVWNFDRVCGTKQLHQNEKPVSLIELCINKHSKENDIVFDGFAGSGTTGIACKNTNRNYILIEKDEKYYNLAKERINNV